MNLRPYVPTRPSVRRALKPLERGARRVLQQPRPGVSGRTLVASAIGLVAGALAVWVANKARQAERDHPPAGQFIELDGVRLHYVERGEGPPVVLIHGNTVTSADFEASGLMDSLAARHRVIAFDRPGYGHSTRPRNRLWTPAAQAYLLYSALQQLGVERPVVVGHSMGTLVALALALDHPSAVQRLVLLSGYHYPELRVDALLTAPVALPVIGDVLRYTVTAAGSRVMLNPAMKAMFAPNEVPAGFVPTLSKEIMVRPVQLRANAEDAAFMMPAARSLSDRYHELQMPVALLAGADDAIVDPAAHSERLHRELPQSSYASIAGVGHMVHHGAAAEVLAAVMGTHGAAATPPGTDPADQA